MTPLIERAGWFARHTPQFALEGGTDGHATTERCRPRSNAVIAYPFANHALAYS